MYNNVTHISEKSTAFILKILKWLIKKITVRGVRLFTMKRKTEYYNNAFTLFCKGYIINLIRSVIMNANCFLKNAQDHLKERGKCYDSENGERSMPTVVKCFNAITGHSITNEQGWLLMVLLKIVRSHQGSFKQDSYEDMAAYAALMGEEAFYNGFK